MTTAAPTTDNAALDFLNGVIGALMSSGEVAAEAYITASDPALFAIPIVAWIIDEGVVYLGQILSIAGQKFGDALIIDFQTGSEQASVLSTGTALAIAQASGNAAAIASAVASASNAWKSAINFDGWGTPT